METQDTTGIQNGQMLSGGGRGYWRWGFILGGPRQDIGVKMVRRGGQGDIGDLDCLEGDTESKGGSLDALVVQKS